MARTHAELTEEWKVPRWSTGFWGVRFAGTLGGILADLLTEGARLALQATYLVPFVPGAPLEVPEGGIAALAQDAGLGGWDAATAADVQGKWDFWTQNPKASIAQELGGATVTVPDDYTGSFDAFAPDYWSRFWIAPDEHPVVGPPPTVGGAIVGTTVLGPAGLTAAYTNRVKQAARRSKPAQWVHWDTIYDDTAGSGQVYRTMAFPRIDPNFAAVTWTPGALPALHLWYDGDHYSDLGSSAFRLTDRSGNGRHLPSPSVGVQPSFSAHNIVGAGTQYCTAQFNIPYSTSAFYVAFRFADDGGGTSLENICVLDGVAAIRQNGANLDFFSNDYLAGVSFARLPGIGGSSTMQTIVVQVDTTQATDPSRVKLWVNGTPVATTAHTGVWANARQAPALASYSVMSNDVGFRPWVGRVQWLVFGSGVLSSAEVAKLSAWTYLENL